MFKYVFWIVIFDMRHWNFIINSVSAFFIKISVNRKMPTMNKSGLKPDLNQGYVFG